MKTMLAILFLSLSSFSFAESAQTEGINYSDVGGDLCDSEAPKNLSFSSTTSEEPEFSKGENR